MRSSGFLRFFSCAILVLGLTLGSVGARAEAIETASAPLSTPVKMQPSVAVQDATQALGEQFQALVTGGQENVDLEPQETFGTRALGVLLSLAALVHDQSLDFVNRVAAFPDIALWFQQQISNDTLRARWLLIGQRLIVVVGGGLCAGWLAAFITMPLRRAVKRRKIASLGARVGILTLWLFLSLVPLLVFLGTAVSLINQGEPSKLVRYVVMTVVYAVTVLSLVQLGARFLLAPRTPHLRLLPVNDAQARYVKKWISAFASVMVVGFFLPDVARFVRVPSASIATFGSAIALLVTLMTILVIVQNRASVSSFLRGELGKTQKPVGLWDSLRLALAQSWHVLAIAYLIVGYVVTTISAGGGFARMQEGTLLTLLVLLAVRLSFYAAGRIGFGGLSEPLRRTSILKPVLEIFLRLFAVALGFAGIAAAWGADVGGWVLSPWGQRILGSVFTIGATVLIVVAIYEALHAAIDRNLNKQEGATQGGEPSARARTLLPMLHNAAIIVLVVIVGLVTLSEMGINIAPLLAGAGVLGVAVGFGSQTLIKDFLTGLFIILENTIAVGDIVTIGDSSGVVDGLTIRTVRLRDFSGNLHIIPFSDITKVINMTKEYAFATLDMGVAYDSDLKYVMEVMREVGETLRTASPSAPDILEPLEMLGVESFNDSSITIRARLKTRPGRQWAVRRAFNLAIKDAFDRVGIEIPFPTVTQIRREG